MVENEHEILSNLTLWYRYKLKLRNRAVIAVLPFGHSRVQSNMQHISSVPINPLCNKVKISQTQGKKINC